MEASSLRPPPPTSTCTVGSHTGVRTSSHLGLWAHTCHVVRTVTGDCTGLGNGHPAIGQGFGSQQFDPLSRLGYELQARWAPWPHGPHVLWGGQAWSPWARDSPKGKVQEKGVCLCS